MLTKENEKPITEYQRTKNMVEIAKVAEDARLDIFGIGESHQQLFVSSSPQNIMATLVGVTN
ncbi:hypothetical protein [Bacillus sp. JJ1562]|uniref:hypothetical protein n=1 Tax=Bacillus sp. JJ1562 TaxID=3122960 RepID=UPI0030033093